MHALTKRLGGSRKTPRRFVGLDLGRHAIKLAALEESPDGITLVTQLVQELPMAQDAQSVDRVGWLQSALTEFGAREVHVAVSGPEVAVRRVHLPLMSPQERSEAVRWQVKDELPFPVQQAEVAFQVLGDVWAKDIKKHDVLVAAAPTAFLRELIAAVERSGARVASLLPSPLAVWACAAALMPETRQGTVALIEVGAQTTHLVIVRDGHVRMVRDVDVGSATLTKALVGETVSERGPVTIDPSKAAALTRRYGVFAGTPEGHTEDGVPLFQLASLMRPILENLLTEVSRFFDFYKTQLDEAGVSRVLLCGGGANLKQLPAVLAEGVGATVDVLNPLVRMPHTAHLEAEQVAEEGPRLVVAIGAALDHGQGLNLVPREIRRARASGFSQRIGVTAAKWLAAAALIFYVGLQLTAFALAQQVRRAQTAWAQAEPLSHRSISATSTQRALEGAIGHVQRLLDEQQVWDGVFKELGQLIPAPAMLEELSVRAEESAPAHPLRMQLKGRIASGGTAAQGSISQFVGALERSVFFRNVELKSSGVREGEASATTFVIDGVLE